MSEKFKVVTDTGGLVSRGPSGGGLNEDVAQSDAKRRNEKAEGLGIKTRYEVKPL